MGSRDGTRPVMFHHPPKPLSATGLPVGRTSPHPAGGRQEVPTPLPTPPRAPGRLGTLVCSPFLLPGYNYTSLGSSGNTNFFPQASLGIASGTAELIQHALGFVLPPRRFLPPGSPGTALAQAQHHSLPLPQLALAFAPQPGSPGGSGQGKGGDERGGNMRLFDRAV